MEASVRLKLPLLAANAKTAASPRVADALLRVSALGGAPKSDESSVIKTHLCRGFARERVTPNALRCRSARRRSQFGDQPQDVGEEVSRDRDLGHLERDIAAVADDLRADLDQLLSEDRQRPVLDRLGRRQRAQEIPDIVASA